ncbi:TnsA endonuclease N-terminal domain-containing protein [Fibrella forsythiae]|uniref:TnsA endonuclease N-terminal domain-containing protein n=1 Tax=Fibrella forsythiae TaxID=2817061 RepID=A0ABS3JRL1_9BACT|nr:TnsA endonuclease N-terminal domain-containing protein [Fibrella forsythiae]MBO0952628.1 TnsA endonuclease N-terminal domain-containing protein [Fibrella forsythiae]
MISLLEFDTNVESYEEQPVCIHYIDQAGKPRTYTPDMLIRYRQERAPGCWLKPRLCEVKYRVDLWAKWHELKPKFRAAVQFAAENGMEFKILTEKEIRTEYLENARFLNRYRTVLIEPGYVERLEMILKQVPQTTPQEIIQLAARDLVHQAHYLYVLWHMVSLEMVGIELTHKLSMKTPIWSLDGPMPHFSKPRRRL